MDTSHQGAASAQVCPVQASEVPGCSTGPAGRLFVAREAVAALRRRRGRRTDSRAQSTTRETR